MLTIRDFKPSFRRTLRRHGVEYVEGEPSVGLKCAACGKTWAGITRRGGRMARRFWQCPNGCNSET